MDNLFEIGADGLDTAAIVAEIQATVERKTREGVYSDPHVARAERSNLANLKNEENFLTFYLDCLRDAVFVDINDFDIYERRRRFSRALVAFKRLVWKMLKFYTYRLWSQQNQVNGLLVAAVDGMDRKNVRKIQALEARIAELEQKLGDGNR